MRERLQPSSMRTRVAEQPRLFAMRERIPVLPAVAFSIITMFGMAHASLHAAKHEASDRTSIVETACPPSESRRARARSGFFGLVSAVCSRVTRGTSAAAADLPQADASAGLVSAATSQRSKECRLCGEKVSSRAEEAHVRQAHGRGVKNHRDL